LSADRVRRRGTKGHNWSLSSRGTVRVRCTTESGGVFRRIRRDRDRSDRLHVALTSRRSEYLRKKISRIRGVGVSHPRSVIRTLFRSVATGTDKSKNDLDRIAAFSETWSMQTNGAPTWF